MNYDNQTLSSICPSCGAGHMSIFYEVAGVPVHSVLLHTQRQEALDYPKGDIRLGYCQSCGFVSNVAFDPSVHEYSAKYESTQGYSSTFNAFHRRLAQNLIAQLPPLVEALTDYGHAYGMVFQIVDDILDFEATDSEKRIALASFLATFGEFENVNYVKFTVDGETEGDLGGRQIEDFWGAVSLADGSRSSAKSPCPPAVTATDAGRMMPTRTSRHSISGQVNPGSVAPHEDAVTDETATRPSPID